MKISSLLVSDRSNFSPYGISPTSLIFKKRDEESVYRDITLENITPHVRAAFSFAIFINALYGILDIFIYTDSNLLTYALITRFFLVMPPLVAHSIFSFRKNFKVVSQKSGKICFFVVGLGWVVFAYGTNDSIVTYNIFGVLMTLIYGFFFTGLFFINAVYVALSVVVFYSFAIWSVDMKFAAAISLNTSLVVIFIMLALASYQKEVSSRQLFITETRQKELSARQRRSDARYLDWLQQLAKFLRHEVRQPVAQINSSLELVQLDQGISENAISYLSSASLSNQAVWALIERASRATDATAFIRQGHPARHDLGVLLDEVLQGFRQTYSGVEIRYIKSNNLYVYTDAIAIKEAISNLLNNAISYAEDDTSVVVKIIEKDSDAIVSIYNVGPLLSNDLKDLFRPFASTRSERDSEHHGLGLYIVKLIVEHYGGAAWIGNTLDKTGVEACFRLPLFRAV